MGRRTKLLKPHSWGATDICLFSVSPSVSVSLTRQHYLSPHFMGLILSACICILTAAPALLAALFPLILLLFSSLFSLLFPVVLLFLLSEKPAGCLGPNLTT